MQNKSTLEERKQISDDPYFWDERNLRALDAAKADPRTVGFTTAELQTFSVEQMIERANRAWGADWQQNC